MDANELAEFGPAIAEAEQLLERSAAVIEHAKSKSHGDIYEHVDIISKRISELRVRCEWLRLVAAGVIEPSAVADLKARQGVDRRSAIDRRIAGMRRQLISSAATLKKIG
jgi:hypothetical protein